MARLAFAPPTSEQMFEAEHKGTVTESTEATLIDPDLKDEMRKQGADSVEGKVERVGAGKVRMYRPGPMGWEPIIVNTNSIADLIRAGYKAACGDCGRDTCTEDRNACPGRDPRKFMRCPVCSKRMYDFDTTRAREGADAADPNEINIVEKSTPEARVRARWIDHMRFYHRAECAQYEIQAAEIGTPLNMAVA